MSATILDVPESMRVLSDNGVLDHAAVHVAIRVADLAAVDDERERLALALAVRAPQRGHVALDLGQVAKLLDVEELAALEASEVTALRAALAAMVAHVRSIRDAMAAGPLPGASLIGLPRATTAGDTTDATPTSAMVVDGDLLYTTRWFDLQRRAIAALASLRRPLPIDRRPGDATVDDAVGAVLGPEHQAQRAAARSSLDARLTVLAGGPGTGKTWTVARLLAVHALAAPDGRPPTVALAAPTGKAAARLREGVEEALADDGLPAAATRAVAAMLDGTGTTLHGLLGMRPGRSPWHDRHNPLPHDLVVVDEASMVSLPLMVSLLDAVPASGRLVLVGDPDQLASVEAGTVLGDLVGALAADRDPALTVLERVYRFAGDSAIAQLATAVRQGRVDSALEVLEQGGETTWHRSLDDAAASLEELTTARASRLVAAARAGQVDAALTALGDTVVLSAHHRGPTGVEALNDAVESWLAGSDLGWRPWDDRQLGRPVLVTANDRWLGVNNGDLGVFVRVADGTTRVAFDLRDDQGVPLTVHPDRLPDHHGVHAMTIHKSQGSQWGHVVVVLPERPSPLLSRQLLYTALTRARDHVTVIGSPDILAAAISTPIARSSGLAAGLQAAQP